jgi:hypothetical protein
VGNLKLALYVLRTQKNTMSQLRSNIYHNSKNIRNESLILVIGLGNACNEPTPKEIKTVNSPIGL